MPWVSQGDNVGYGWRFFYTVIKLTNRWASYENESWAISYHNGETIVISGFCLFSVILSAIESQNGWPSSLSGLRAICVLTRIVGRLSGIYILVLVSSPVTTVPQYLSLGWRLRSELIWLIRCFDSKFHLRVVQCIRKRRLTCQMDELCGGLGLDVEGYQKTGMRRQSDRVILYCLTPIMVWYTRSLASRMDLLRDQIAFQHFISRADRHVLNISLE